MTNFENKLNDRLRKLASLVCEDFRKAALVDDNEELVAILVYVTSYPAKRVGKFVYGQELPNPKSLAWMAGCLDLELVMKAVPCGAVSAVRQTLTKRSLVSRFAARPREDMAALALAALLAQALQDYSLQSVAELSGLKLAKVKSLTKKCRSFELAERILATVGLTLSIKCRDPYADVAGGAGNNQPGGGDTQPGASNTQAGAEACDGACATRDDWRQFIARSHVLARKVVWAQQAGSSGQKRLGERHCNG